jgi:hypothetical protein
VLTGRIRIGGHAIRGHDSPGDRPRPALGCGCRSGRRSGPGEEDGEKWRERPRHPRQARRAPRPPPGQRVEAVTDGRPRNASGLERYSVRAA